MLAVSIFFFCFGALMMVEARHRNLQTIRKEAKIAETNKMRATSVRGHYRWR